MFLRPLPTLTALLLGAACSLLVACGGGGSSKLLPQSRASELTEAIDDVQRAADDRKCGAVEPAIARAQRVANNLSGEVDRDLRRDLRDGVKKLEAQALDECAAVETTSTPTTDTAPATTETAPPPTVSTETAPPTTTQTIPTTTTPATPTETTPADPTAPQDDTGGITPGVGDDTGGGITP